MRISKDMTIAGIPIMDVRDALRRGDRLDHIGERDVKMKLGEITIRRGIDEFVHLGWAQKAFPTETRRWHIIDLTPAGRRAIGSTKPKEGKIAGIGVDDWSTLLRNQRRYGLNGERRLLNQAVLSIGDIQWTAIKVQLLKEGFLEEEARSNGESSLHLTTKGAALTQAKFIKPIPRHKADVLLKEVVNRAQEVNASTNHLCYVKKIGVFGSYAKGACEVGDLDLYVEIGCKSHPSMMWTDWAREAFNKTGKRLNRIGEQYDFWHVRAIQHLKNKRQHLGITTSANGLPKDFTPLLVFEHDVATGKTRVETPLRQRMQIYGVSFTDS